MLNNQDFELGFGIQLFTFHSISDLYSWNNYCDVDGRIHWKFKQEPRRSEVLLTKPIIFTKVIGKNQIPSFIVCYYLMNSTPIKAMIIEFFQTTNMIHSLSTLITTYLPKIDFLSNHITQLIPILN